MTAVALAAKMAPKVRRSVVCEYRGAHSYAGRILTQLKTQPAAAEAHAAGSPTRAKQNRPWSHFFARLQKDLAHSVALHYMHYNFAKIHKTLRVTPAMEAGLADHVWGIDEIIGLLDRRSAVAA